MARSLFRLTLGLLVLALASPSHAALIITLRDDGIGGTLAAFEGAGTTDPKGFQVYIDAHEIGDFIAENGPENSLFSLATPLNFGVGRNILGLHLDRNPDRLDDLRVQMDGYVDVGFDFSVLGESLVSGLRFADLVQGTYAASTRPDVAIIGGLTLIVEPPLPVLEPTTMSLLVGGLGLLWLRARRRNAKPEAVVY